MYKIITLFLLCSVCYKVVAQSEQDSLYLFSNYTKKEVMIPMRDGVRLFTAIYAPKDTSEKHPILIYRTPYSSRPYGEGVMDRYFWSSYWRYYLRENYILVMQDVRGKSMSEGEFVDIRPFNPNKKGKETDEASDTYDAIDWLINNVPGNNGNVGVQGISYPGFYSTMAALSGHPALKAVSPQAPVTDWFIGDDFHHNGAFLLMEAYSFYAGSFGFGYSRKAPTKAKKIGSFPMPQSDNYTFYMKMGAVRNFANLVGDSVLFWRDLVNHPDMDGWWKARNVRNFVSGVKPAMLTVGGLFDAEDCFGAWSLYKAIEEKNPKDKFNKIVMGPWSHGQWSMDQGYFLGNIDFGSNTCIWFQNNIEIPFFNYYLKGKGNINSIAEASIFFTGSNEWKQFEQWPPSGRKQVSLYFHERGKISLAKPLEKVAFTEYISDPAHPVPYTEDVHSTRTKEYMNDDQRFASRRPDVITFETDVLEQDLKVGGELVANLIMSLTTTDADIVVKLIDVFPDDFKYTADAEKRLATGNGKNYPMGGYQMLVRGEVMRGRYRNSFEKPQAFSTGKAEQVRFALPDIAHVFKKGHKIMVQIQSSWFPLIDRNPQQFVNIYTCDDSAFMKSTIRLYHDASRPSSIILSVIE